MRVALILLILSLQVFSMDNEDLFKSLEDLEGSEDSRITSTEIGRYCITKPFFKDSKDYIENDLQEPFLNKWSQCTNKLLARTIIIGYWKRYCPEALKNGDVRVLAAVFRKGPRGYETNTGIQYGKRALALYYVYKKASDKTGSDR